MGRFCVAHSPAASRGVAGAASFFQPGMTLGMLTFHSSKSKNIAGICYRIRHSLSALEGVAHPHPRGKAWEAIRSDLGVAPRGDFFHSIQPAMMKTFSMVDRPCRALFRHDSLRRSTERAYASPPGAVQKAIILASGGGCHPLSRLQEAVRPPVHLRSACLLSKTLSGFDSAERRCSAIRSLSAQWQRT